MSGVQAAEDQDCGLKAPGGGGSPCHARVGLDGQRPERLGLGRREVGQPLWIQVLPRRGGNGGHPAGEQERSTGDQEAEPTTGVFRFS